MKRFYFDMALWALALLAAGMLAEPVCAGVILSQNFDDTGTFSPSTSGNVGDAATTGGRWGVFTPVVNPGDPGTSISTAQALSGTQSVLATRPGGVIGRVDTAVSQSRYTIAYSIFQPSADTGDFIMHTSNAANPADLNLANIIRNNGRVDYWGGAWISSGAFVPVDTWTEIRLEVDETAGNYDLYVGGAFAVTVAPTNFPAGIDRFLFNPQGVAGTSVYIDDVSITQIPEPSSLALVGLGALALLWRRKV